MRETRSSSQILFGFLPEQTVDLRGHVWKVRKWRRPLKERNVDQQALREELSRLASPWSSSRKDGGFVRDLHRGIALTVYTLDVEHGVEVQPYPGVWICRGCNRILKSLEHGRCRCGSTASPTNLHFVGYHDACGRLHEPRVKRCREHDDVRVVWPGTASAAEIRFECPQCARVTQKGLGMPKCTCGGEGRVTYTVHRASSVYTPQPAVIVNPPSPEKLRRLHDAGGAPRALSWILAGMPTRTLDEWANTASALRRQLIRQGMDPDTADRMVDVAVKSGEVVDDRDGEGAPEGVTQRAESEAVTLAMAFSESRTRIRDLPRSVPEDSPLRRLYLEEYPKTLRNAGLSTVDLVDTFPVFTGHFGYTRGSQPLQSRLVPFRDSEGYAVYGHLGITEALFVGLDPSAVAGWLNRQGFDIGDWDDEATARRAILRNAHPPGPADDVPHRTAGSELLTLVHSYAHRFIRLAAAHAGIDRNALSELLVPSHAGFFVYAAARGDFVLGGLQAVFETELHKLLHAIVHEEHRCPLDPGCTSSGGACMACIHLGEPSCRLFNRFLDRSTLSGPRGYLRH